MEIEIRKVTIVRPRCGPDHISIEIQGPCPYPTAYPGEMPTLEVRCEVGYAEKWCDQMGIIPNLIITVPENEFKFNKKG